MLSRTETDYKSLWQDEVQSRSQLGLQVVSLAIRILPVVSTFRRMAS